MLKKKSYSLNEAKKKLENFCSYQERCHKEVKEKLRELGMIQSASQEIIAQLIQEDYLNETRFAKNFARGKFRIKNWGRNRISRELKSRNISDYNIKMGMQEFTDIEYEETFYNLIEKRKKSVEHLPIDQQKKKIFSYLSYRGWEHEKIFDALNQL
tara:strand:+ start:1624 stop:2091 length:468 start_codon:yes stop_codon:yes gene_type:complete